MLNSKTARISSGPTPRRHDLKTQTNDKLSMTSLFRRLAFKLSILGYFRQGLRKIYATPGNIDRQTLILQHQFIHQLLAQPRYADPKRLSRFEHQVFSQNGEDGVLAEIFRRIGTTDRYFLEIGVGDGLENNTTFFLSQGWKGVWIDGDDSSIAKIKKTFWQPLARGDLQARQSLVTAENISSTLAELKVPTEFDLFSLDIDRNTYFIWQALKHLRPRVLVIEYNSTYPAFMDWTVEYRPELVYNCTSYMGASLKAYERLGAELGYALVGCELGGINAFFVRRDLCGDKFAEPFTAENHFEPARYFLLRRDGHPRCFTDIAQPEA
jgi:hypothetical protein